MRKQDAIDRIKAGHPLICEHDEDGAAKYLVAGGGYRPQNSTRYHSQASARPTEGCSIRRSRAPDMAASMTYSPPSPMLGYPMSMENWPDE